MLVFQYYYDVISGSSPLGITYIKHTHTYMTLISLVLGLEFGNTTQHNVYMFNIFSPSTKIW